MFCPNCDGYILESGLIRSNVKKWDNTDIEYDARCSLCNVEIGRMSWGKLELNEAMQKKQAQSGGSDNSSSAAEGKSAPEKELPYFFPPLPEQEIDEDESESSTDDWKLPQNQNSTPDKNMAHYCPHCGKDLPSDINLIPKKFIKNS